MDLFYFLISLSVLNITFYIWPYSELKKWPPN